MPDESLNSITSNPRVLSNFKVGLTKSWAVSDDDDDNCGVGYASAFGSAAFSAEPDMGWIAPTVISFGMAEDHRELCAVLAR